MRLACVVLLAACADLGPSSRVFPRWTARSAEIAWRDCAGLRAFVRKSGKQGIGVTVELRTRRRCDLTFTRAEVVLADGTRAPAELPAARPPGRSLRYLWTPIRFDGDAAWNRGVRAGALELELTVDGTPQPTVVVPLVQAR